MKLRYVTLIIGLGVAGLGGYRWSQPIPSLEPVPVVAQFPTPDPVEPVETAVAEPVISSTLLWSGALKSGGTFDGLLAEAGLDHVQRAEASRLIGGAYDLRRLKPGYLLQLAAVGDLAVPEVTLEVEDGRHFVATLGATPAVRVVTPEPETVVRAAEAEVRSSIYGALERVQAPTRFATDLELILADILNLRRELAGGEVLRLVWREARIGDRVIGEPVIDFAQFDLGGETYEIIWPQEGSARNYIYKDGALLESFRQPVLGARLSSAFGPRIHPVHGGRRMHQGVDFAADEGMIVHAMQEGEVAFAGAKSGYGTLIELTHAGDVVTRYGHLSSDGLAVKAGDRVERGQAIGRVGNTGTSTAPHLHYEVIVRGQHVSPLNFDWPFRSGTGPKDPAHLQATLEKARDRLALTLEDAQSDG